MLALCSFDPHTCRLHPHGSAHQAAHESAAMNQLKSIVFCVAILLQLGSHLQAAQDEEDDRLIGWKGETYQAEEHHKGYHASTAGREPWIEIISWEPRAAIYHGFLSYEECDHLRSLALKRLSRSMVTSDNGKDMVDPVRTSHSASLNFHEDDIVRGIEERIAEWTHLPKGHGEPIEVLRYRNNQKYDAHWDYFGGTTADEPQGDRIATVLMYLSDVEPGGGGETSFPLGEALDPVLQSTESMSPCANVMGIAITPRKGDVLLFWDSYPDPTISDRKSLHTACPTFKGEKWTATKWIHAREYINKYEVALAEKRLEFRRQQQQHVGQASHGYDVDLKGGGAVGAQAWGQHASTNA